MRKRPVYGYDRAKWKREEIVSNWVREYKIASGCEKCRNVDPDVLEFHHRDRTTKKANVADLVAKGYSVERVRDEIALCNLLCAHCHRKSHRDENGVRCDPVASDSDQLLLLRLETQARIACKRGKADDPELMKLSALLAKLDRARRKRREIVHVDPPAQTVPPQEA